MARGATIYLRYMPTPATSKTPAQERADILAKHRASDKYIGVFPFEFDDAKAEAAIPTTIQLVPIGQWEHDLYGQILITPSDIQEFVDNFDAKVRKGVPITAGHEGMEELPAQGWIIKVVARADGLWGDVEWTEAGKALLADKAFKFFSPEFYREYEDPQTHTLYRNVLVGGALTKSPYFKELQAIMFSEPKIKKLFTDTMNIEELAKKNVADLTADEVAFVKANKDTLTDEQKTHFTSVIDEPAAEETAEEKEAREKAEGDANEAAGLNRDGSAKAAPAADAAAPATDAEIEAAGGEVVAGSDRVALSRAAFSALTNKANQGAEAFAELKKKKIDEQTDALMFSDKNKEGKFLPKSKDNLRAFIETLQPAQATAFTALMTQLPKSGLFSEAGAGGKAVEGTAMAEVEAKTAAKMSEKKLGYAEALREVFSENAGLETRYDAELSPVRG